MCCRNGGVVRADLLAVHLAATLLPAQAAAAAGLTSPCQPNTSLLLLLTIYQHIQQIAQYLSCPVSIVNALYEARNFIVLEYIFSLNSSLNRLCYEIFYPLYILYYYLAYEQAQSVSQTFSVFETISNCKVHHSSVAYSQ